MRNSKKPLLNLPKKRQPKTPLQEKIENNPEYREATRRVIEDDEGLNFLLKVQTIQTIKRIGARTTSLKGFAPGAYTGDTPDPEKFKPYIEIHGSDLGCSWNGCYDVILNGERVANEVNYEEGFEYLQSEMGYEISPRSAFEKHTQYSKFWCPRRQGWFKVGDVLKEWKLKNNYHKPLTWGPLYPAGIGNGTIYSLDEYAYTQMCFMTLNGLKCKSSGDRLIW